MNLSTALAILIFIVVLILGITNLVMYQTYPCEAFKHGHLQYSGLPGRCVAP